MKTIKTLLTLCLLALVAGCSDTLVAPDAGNDLRVDSRFDTETASKMRFGHLLEAATKTAGKDGSDTGVIVKLKPQKVMERYRIMERYRVMERYRIMERYTYDYAFGGFAITADTETLPELFAVMAADTDIEWFQPDFTVSGKPFALGYQSRPNGGELVPWSLEKIGAVQQEKISEVEDVVIFIVDTGVEHEDVKLEYEFDFGTSSETGGVDPEGHGTHIAGIAAAEINGKGVAGIAPKAKVYSLRVLGNESAEAVASDELDLSTAIASVDYITRFKHENQHVPVVANLSFGADVKSTDYTALDEAIAASSAVGVTYVVSAGNGGVDASTYTPAHTAEAITVGAYGPDGALAWFSNHGAMVDVQAPGVDILSLRAGEEKDSQNYALMSGTSMAAAHVTGAVARFIAVNQQASPRQVAEAIVASGRDWVTGAPLGTTGVSVYVGSGHLDNADGGSGLMQTHLGPFRDYAVFADSKFKIDGTAFIAAAAENANVLTNGSIELKTDASRIAGFGYYTGSVKEELAAPVFVPAFNGLGLPAFSETSDNVLVEEFEPQAFAHLATDLFDGSTDFLGAYDLGDGGILYVDGNLKIVGPTAFTGSGIVIVRGSMEIKSAFQNTGGKIGFYIGGNLKAKTEIGAPIALDGALYADTIVFENDVTLSGQVTAVNAFEVKEDYTLRMTFERAPEALIAPLWAN